MVLWWWLSRCYALDITRREDCGPESKSNSQKYLSVSHDVALRNGPAAPTGVVAKPTWCSAAAAKIWNSPLRFGMGVHGFATHGAQILVPVQPFTDCASATSDRIFTLPGAKSVAGKPRGEPGGSGRVTP